MDETHAISRASGIGIYFDGVSNGIDCKCCGDRWYSPDEGSEFPEIYDMNVREPEELKTLNFPMAEGKEICIHTLDGNKEWYDRKYS
jgi:hypothetical protein